MGFSRSIFQPRISHEGERDKTRETKSRQISNSMIGWPLPNHQPAALWLEVCFASVFEGGKRAEQMFHQPGSRGKQVGGDGWIDGEVVGKPVAARWPLVRRDVT